jgi:hypothetical protein
MSLPPKAADDSAAQGRVQLAAIAEAERQVQHAEDHGQGGGKNGAEAVRPAVSAGAIARTASAKSDRAAHERGPVVSRRDVRAL